MGFGQNALIFSLFLSIGLLVAGAPKPFGHDILDTFYDINGQQVGISSTTAGALPQNPQSSAPNVNTGVSAGNSFQITDGLSLVFGFIKMLLNVISMPIGLLTYAGLPAELVMFIAVPVVFLEIIGIVALVRGTFSW